MERLKKDKTPTNDQYYIDHDRSSCLYYVEIIDDKMILKVTFQKTPGRTYEFFINPTYKEFVKDFFSDAEANESRSWGKTYHLLKRLNWIN